MTKAWKVDFINRLSQVTFEKSDIPIYKEKYTNISDIIEGEFLTEEELKNFGDGTGRLGKIENIKQELIVAPTGIFTYEVKGDEVIVTQTDGHKYNIGLKMHFDKAREEAFEAGKEGADIKGYDHEDQECDMFNGSMMSAKIVFKYETFEDYMKDKGGECD